MTKPTPVRETVIVRASMLGHSEEGLGQAYVDTGELTGDLSVDRRIVGEAFSGAYVAALRDAITDLQSSLPTIFQRGQER